MSKELSPVGECCENRNHCDYFASKSLCKSLRSQGYFISSLISASDCEELLELYAETLEGPKEEFSLTAVHSSLETRRTVSDSIQRIIEKPLKRIVPGYEISMIGLAAKQACTSNATLPLHADYRLRRLGEKPDGLVIWVALDDVNVENGCMHLVPGSHRLDFNHIAAYPKNPSAFDFLDPLLVERLMKPLPMKAGEVLVFNEGLFHTTKENAGDEVRVALFGPMLPRGSKPVLYEWNEERPNWINLYQISSDFLHRFRPETLMDPTQMGAEFIARLPYHPRELSSDDISLLLGFPETGS